MPLTYQQCSTAGGAARIWIGPIATSLTGDCNDYYEYTASGATTSTASAVPVTSATDNTTIDQSNYIMNVGYVKETKEVFLAYDKTSSGSLTAFDAKRGVSKLNEYVSGGETTFAKAITNADKIRFTGEYYDFSSALWTSHDTLNAVKVSIGTEYDTFGTNQRGAMDVFNGAKSMKITAEFPLNFEAKYIKAITAGDPVVVHDDNATPSLRLYQALYTNLSGKRTEAKSLVIVPEYIARDVDNRNTDDEIILYDSFWVWKAVPKITMDFEYNKGSQIKMTVEFEVLFDNFFQGFGLNNPLAYLGTHYPSQI